ncbi:hypothetical protein D3C77_782890 [compost metagenome]
MAEWIIPNKDSREARQAAIRPLSGLFCMANMVSIPHSKLLRGAPLPRWNKPL